MDPVIGVMLDVVRIAAFLPSAGDTEIRPTEPECEPATEARPPISQRLKSRVSQFMVSLVGLIQVNAR